MSFTSPPHCSIVTRLSKWSHQQLAKKPVGIRVYCPIVDPAWPEPLVPDIAWVQDKSYFRAHPTPQDVLLLIEVADEATLADDCGPKMELLARSGVAEYWVVNLNDCLIYVFRQPRGMAYQEIRTLSLQETVSPLAFPELKLPVMALLAFS